MWKSSQAIASLGILAAFAVSCADAMERPSDVAGDDLGGGVLQIEVAEADVTQLPEGTPGEASAGQSVDKARDCVYIEWCNEPGPRGTICRVRPECGCSGVIECNEDARAVCGGFVDPAYFLCNR